MIGRFDIQYEDVHVGSRGEDHGLWAVMDGLEGKNGYFPIKFDFVKTRSHLLGFLQVHVAILIDTSE